MEAKNNFVIDTKGLCLLCLSDVGTHDSNGHVAVTPKTSLLPFLRYLQINVLNSNSSSSPTMGGLQDNSIVATMCRWCAAMTNQFTDMFTTWEMIRLKMDDCVQLMQQQMLIGNGDSARINEYVRRMKGSVDPFDIFNANIVETLRKEAVDKCSTRANLISPLPPQNYHVPPNNQMATPTTRSEPLIIHIPEGLNDMIPVGGAISCNLLTVPSPSDSNVLPTYDYQSINWKSQTQELPYVPHDSGENEKQLYVDNKPVSIDTSVGQEQSQCFISETGNLVVVDNVEKIPPKNAFESSSSFSSASMRSYGASVDNNNEVFIPPHQVPFPINQTGLQYCNRSLPPRKRKECHQDVDVEGPIKKTPSHEENELPKLSERCCLCNETLKTNFAIKFHMIGVHAYHMIKPYLPPGTTNNLLLDINTELQKMLQDLRVNIGCPYGCPYCNRQYDGKNLLKAHLIQMHCDKIAERIILSTAK